MFAVNTKRVVRVLFLIQISIWKNSHMLNLYHLSSHFINLKIYWYLILFMRKGTSREWMSHYSCCMFCILVRWNFVQPKVAWPHDGNHLTFDSYSRLYCRRKPTVESIPWRVINCVHWLCCSWTVTCNYVTFNQLVWALIRWMIHNIWLILYILHVQYINEQFDDTLMVN